MSPICKGKSHTRHEIVTRVPTPDQPLFIKEQGKYIRCGTIRNYQRIIELGTFNGSLDSNPQVNWRQK